MSAYASRGQERVWLELQVIVIVNCPMWALELQMGSFTRAVQILKHWIESLSPGIFILSYTFIEV